MSVSPKDRCGRCAATGLAVMLARYAVAPADFPADLGPFSGDRVKSVPLGALYKNIVRGLRAGYVYVLYEKGPFGSNYYETYSIGADGGAWLQPGPLLAAPPTSCSREGHSPQRMQFIVIRKPEQCGKVWIAFSQHKWGQQTLDRYRDNPGSRSERFQMIQPAEWITAPSPGPHSVAINSFKDIQQVVEWDPTQGFSASGEHPDLPHGTRPLALSDRNGGYNARALEQCATLYPWHPRIPANDPEKAKKACVDAHAAMLRASPKAGAKEFHKPMLLVLWDAIGATQEINSFRNDAAGRLAQYEQERALQVGALRAIEGAKAAVRANAQRVASTGDPSSYSALRDWYKNDAEKLRNGDWPSDPVRRGQFADDVEWMGKNRVHRGLADQLSYLHTAYESRPWATNEAERVAKYQRERQRILDAAKEDIERQRNAPAEISARADRIYASDWEDYEEELKGPHGSKDYQRFEKKYRQLQAAVPQLQAQRTPAVRAWLSTELFLATLEDYHEQDIADGRAFADVITVATLGLDSEPEGAKVLDELAANFEATTRGSLLWRAVALNQKEMKQELEQALQEASNSRSLVMDAAGAGWAAFTSAIKHLKTFNKFYKSMDEVAAEALPSTVANRVLQAAGGDHLIVNVGNSLFRTFRLNELGDSVGEAVVMSALMVRAGVDSSDVSELVLKHAQLNEPLRKLLFAKWKEYREKGHSGALALALADLSKHRGTEILRSEWKQVADKARFGMRLAAVNGCIEVIGFTKLLMKADKSAKDVGLLVASGLSVVGAYFQIALLANKQMFLESSRSVLHLKMIGGYLGGAGGYIGAVVDGANAAERLRKEQYVVGALYALKGALGFAGASALVLTALSTSTPVLQRFVGRGTAVFFLERVDAGIAGRAAIVAARAAGTQVAVGAIRQGALLGVGRVVLVLAGWQVAVVATLIQVLIWVFTPDALEDWCDESAFGNNPKFRTPEQQQTAFEKALSDVGLPTEALAA